MSDGEEDGVYVGNEDMNAATWCSVGREFGVLG